MGIFPKQRRTEGNVTTPATKTCFLMWVPVQTSASRQDESQDALPKHSHTEKDSCLQPTFVSKNQRRNGSSAEQAPTERWLDLAFAPATHKRPKTTKIRGNAPKTDSSRTWEFWPVRPQKRRFRQQTVNSVSCPQNRKRQKNTFLCF